MQHNPGMSPRCYPSQPVSGLAGRPGAVLQVVRAKVPEVVADAAEVAVAAGSLRFAALRGSGSKSNGKEIPLLAIFNI